MTRNMHNAKPRIRVPTYEGSYDEMKANKRKKTIQNIQEKYSRCPHCGLFTDKTKAGKCKNWIEDKGNAA